MKRLVLLLAGSLLLAACSGGDGDKESRRFFGLPKADEAAHAALFDAPDLPGTGWEVTARDEPDDDSFDFVAAARSEPACATFNNLSALSEAGGIFESNEEKAPGWASIELQRANAAQLFPVQVQMEVEIETTVAAIQSSGQVAKSFLESDDLKKCMSNVINKMFASQVASSGLNVVLTPKNASAAAPQDGATMAFLMKMSIPRIVEIDAVMEMYMWPYANAGVTVMVLGQSNNLNKELIEAILRKADEKVIQAEKDY